MEEARAAAAEVLRLKPDFTIGTLRREGLSGVDTGGLREGMRLAGLPE